MFLISKIDVCDDERKRSFEPKQGAAGGLMLFLSFVELLPESVELLGPFIAQLWFFAGVAIMAFVVYFIPGEISEKRKKKRKRWLPDSALLLSTIMIIVIITQKGDNAMSNCAIQSLIQRSSSLLPVKPTIQQQSLKINLN